MTESEPVLRHADLFHTGIVVDDLASAKREFGEALGLTWREGGAAVTMLTDDGARRVESAYAMSREGPHHIELVRSIEDTLWSATGRGSVHHLGYWVDDLVATAADLSGHGCHRMATISMTEDSAPMCAYYLTGNGLCVEIVDRAMRRVLLGRD